MLKLVKNVWVQEEGRLGTWYGPSYVEARGDEAVFLPADVIAQLDPNLFVEVEVDGEDEPAAAVMDDPPAIPVDVTKPAPSKRPRRSRKAPGS